MQTWLFSDSLPRGVNARLKAVWDPIIERFENKLSAWKRQYLPIGDRVTLIKATMSKLLIYLDSIQRNFFVRWKS